ncbi:hypothetical protein, partial [Falsiroseomonas sp. E2-1-a20]|uniref:hypothetical protein n=1 Tax=Falsiroseomonas sp. E2-1-a20 TaxID=3239300 RepID=UPI003F396337
NPCLRAGTPDQARQHHVSAAAAEMPRAERHEKYMTFMRDNWLSDRVFLARAGHWRPLLQLLKKPVD